MDTAHLVPPDPVVTKKGFGVRWLGKSYLRTSSGPAQPQNLSSKPRPKPSRAAVVWGGGGSYIEDPSPSLDSEYGVRIRKVP